jgi:membrane protease YdiL (CAAX protease family)
MGEEVEMQEIKHERFIILSTLLACFILYIVEQGVGVSYAIKTILKIFIFVGLPISYVKLIRKQNIREALKLKNVNLRDFKTGFIAGLLFFTIVMGAYFIVGNQIDFDMIAQELQTKLKVTPLNFIFIGLYITFGNSFLEEFFFRGFIFMNLYELRSKKFAYVYSSILFALYHIAIFKTWFTLPITLLALFGLVSVGFLFNWMDTKSRNFINSWIAHILADIAVILIGLRMFEMI